MSIVDGLDDIFGVQMDGDGRGRVRKMDVMKEMRKGMPGFVSIA